MRRISWIFVILLGLAGHAGAQTLSPAPTVEVAVSAALIQAKPDVVREPYYESWYPAARYGGAVSYYWSRNLKTEYEYAWSHQGSRQLLEYNVIAGVPLPYYFEDFHQLQQHSVRMVYQFRNNQWVHPYLSAGAVLDVDRQHAYIPITYQPSGRGGVALVHPETTTDTRTTSHGGITIGGGAKFYVSERAFFNAGAIGTFAKPRKSVSLLVGIGLDF